MQPHDDDLSQFAASGALPLPATTEQGQIEHDGCRIWYAAYGQRRAGDLAARRPGQQRQLGDQVPALVEDGYRAILIDSRGHGRSTC